MHPSAPEIEEELLALAKECPEIQGTLRFAAKIIEGQKREIEELKTQLRVFFVGFLIVKCKWFRYTGTADNGGRLYEEQRAERYLNTNFFVCIGAVKLERAGSPTQLKFVLSATEDTRIMASVL